MVYDNTFTAAKKARAFEIILRRDGDGCFYCKKMNKDPPHFVFGHPHYKREFEHLNKNEQDHRPENLVIVHAICNEKRRHGNIEMEFLAKDKLTENERNVDRPSLEVSGGQKNSNIEVDELKEADVNLIVNKLVNAYLEEKLLQPTEIISYSNTLRSIHYLTIQQTGGRGSEQAVRRALDAFCSEYSQWEDYKDGTGKRMIRRRKFNEK